MGDDAATATREQNDRGEAREMPLVSLCVVALNEKEYLPDLLSDIVSQTYPHELIEVVLVDSGSDDETPEIMERFADTYHSEFEGVVLLKNEKTIQAAGWNKAIEGSRGEVIIRVDAHATIPASFVANSVKVLEGGEDVCGGARPTLVKSPTTWRRVLHLAEESAFGSSVASYRRNTEPRYVSSVFHGAYRRHVFESAGVFDERLRRTEDNELHYRIRRSGFRICLSPEIRSYQYIRCSLRGMLKQKYLNGYWIGRTLFIEPHCFQAYHFVPLAFVLALLASLILCVTVTPVPPIFLAILYGLADVALSVKAIIEEKDRTFLLLLLPIIFLLIHLSYGFGTLCGLLEGAVRRVKR